MILKKISMQNFPVGKELTLNVPIATKAVSFSRLLKCLRNLYDKQCGYGSTLFVSKINLSIMYGNYLQQTTAVDDIFRCIFCDWCIKGYKAPWLGANITLTDSSTTDQMWVLPVQGLQFHTNFKFWILTGRLKSKLIIESLHENSNNVVCAISKASDQPAYMRSLIRAFDSLLNILWLLSYWRSCIWSFYAWKGAAQARLSLHLSKCLIVGNHMSRLILLLAPQHTLTKCQLSTF